MHDDYTRIYRIKVLIIKISQLIYIYIMDSMQYLESKPIKYNGINI